MEYQFLKVEHTQGITVLKISAPKSLNALNSTILKELDDCVGHSGCCNACAHHHGRR